MASELELSKITSSLDLNIVAKKKNQVISDHHYRQQLGKSSDGSSIIFRSRRVKTDKTNIT